jgi:hypothetical protein
MPFLFSLLVLGLMVFALVDIIRRDDSEVRHLPRVVWVVIVVLLPLIGSALWFALGRTYPEGGPRMPRPAPRATTRTAPAPPAPPRDTRTTEQQLADLEREIEAERLREEIARRRRDQGGATA